MGCIGTIAAASNDVGRLQNTCQAQLPNAQLVIANGHGNYRVNRNGQWIGL